MKECLLKITFFLFLLHSQLLAQDVYWSVASGDFSTLSNWNDAQNGAGNTPTVLEEDDVFIVRGGHTIDLDQSVMVLALEVRNGTFNIPSPLTLTSSGSDFDGVFIGNNGTLNVEDGATLNIDNSADSGLELAGSGVFIMNGNLNITNIGDGDFEDDAMSIFNSTTINGTVVITNFNAGEGIYIAGNAEMIIATGASVQITGQGVGDNGILINDNNSELTVQAGAILTISSSVGDGIDIFNGTLTNAGTINLNSVGDDGIDSSNDVVNSGVINILNPDEDGFDMVSSSSFSNTGTVTITSAEFNGINIFENSTFTNAANGNVQIVSPTFTGLQGAANSTLNNQGVLQVTNPGLLYSGSPALVNSGTLKGEGTLSALNLNLQPGSIVSPGNSPGQMNFNSDTDFTNSILEIEVSSLSNHDIVSVSGLATVGGTLMVSIDYTPTSNDRIVFLTGTAITGSFAISPALPANWSVDYSVPGEVALQFSGILPVELVHFTTTKRSENVLLEWETASEINNKGFNVEYSKDGRTWELLDFISGAGNSNVFNSYSFLHEGPGSGINYYRLRQMDYDGKSELSNIRSVEFNDENSTVNLFPNPARAQTNILLPTDFISAFAQVKNINGQILYENKVENGQSLFPIYLNDFESGLYLVYINIDGQDYIKKLVVTLD